MIVSTLRDDRVSIHRRRDATMETLVGHYTRFAFRPHAHDEYVIGVIVSGIHDVWCRGARRAAGRGTVVTMNPGDVHHGGAGDASGWVQRMIYVSEAALRELVEDAEDGSARPAPRFAEAFREDHGLSDRLAAAHDAIHSQGFRLGRDVLGNQLMGVLVDRFAPGSLVGHALGGGRREPGAARLDRARDYLQAHIEGDVSLDEIAAVVGLGRRRTITLFNAHLGLPPHAYHLMLKINAVKRRLRSGMPVADCAATYGFVDQSHLGRTFRAMVGTTPKAYAAAT